MENETHRVAALEELKISNMHEIHAILKVLDRKGLVNEKEVLEEIQSLKDEYAEKRKRIVQT